MKKIMIDKDEVKYEALGISSKKVALAFGGKEYIFKVQNRGGGEVWVSGQDGTRRIQVSAQTKDQLIQGGNFQYRISKSGGRVSQSKEGPGNHLSPMPGKIFKVLVKEGQKVEKGEPLLIVEAMKMEHTIKASEAGRVAKIFYAEGAQVEGGVELVELKNE